MAVSGKMGTFSWRVRTEKKWNVEMELVREWGGGGVGVVWGW
jgi:hypothetical protein